MPIRFRPPRDIPDLGLTRGQQERFNAWLRTAFTEIAEDMATLGQSDAPTIVAQETIDVAAGSMRRVTPPTGGMAVRVPAPTPANAGQTVRLMIEAPVGDLTVVAVPGVGDDGKVFQPTINGEPRATFTTSGLVTLTSNGSSDWKSASEFAAESPVSIALSSGGAALDAQYLLRSANSRLPNARVADDSTEIDISYSSPGLITWFLKTASVAFSKLANLAGLSVLGRASSTSGVMAAITSTGGHQALRSSPDGSSIGWESYLPAVFTDTVTGSIGTYDLPSTFRSGDTLRFTITGNTTVVGFTIDGSVPPEGTEFNLCLSDQSGGSAPGWTLTIPDAGGGVAQFRTPGQVQGTTPGPSYVMQSEEEGCRCAFQQGAWRIIGGTAAQAVTGDILISAGNGATRDSQIAPGVIVNADVNASAAIAQTKLGATTGFSVKASGSAATTSAEPIITYSASANMSAERVATSAGFINVDLGTAGQVRWVWTGVAVERNNVAVGSGVTSWDYGVTAPLTLSVSIVSNEARVTYGLDLTATIAWTGGHSWNTAGDFDVTAAVVGLNSSSSMGLDAVGTLTLASDANVQVAADALYLSGDGFLLLDGATASTPSLTSDQGMFWVRDPGASATEPMFTDDGNVDLMIAAGGSVVTVSSATGNMGTISIAALRCGGHVKFAPTANFTVEGFSSKPDGFWFHAVTESSSFTTTYNCEDATATAADRIRISGKVNGAGGDTDFGVSANVIFRYSTNRWYCIPPTT